MMFPKCCNEPATISADFQSAATVTLSVPRNSATSMMQRTLPSKMDMGLTLLSGPCALENNSKNTVVLGILHYFALTAKTVHVKSHISMLNPMKSTHTQIICMFASLAFPTISWAYITDARILDILFGKDVLGKGHTAR